MNEAKVYADGFSKSFMRQEEFLMFLRGIGRNSSWIRRRNTASKPLVAHRSSASDNRQLQNAKKARKCAIFRAFSIPKILPGLFGFDGI